MIEQLQEPMVPEDVDLRTFTFMPLDVSRLRDSGLTAKATGDEFRAAVLLWCASWHQVPAASLPDDDDELANICGYGRARREWSRVREGAMRGWTKCSDGRFYHLAVAAKALEAWIEKLASAIGGATGNSKRWNVDIDTSDIKAKFRRAVECLRAIDPQSRTFRKKVVAVLTLPQREQPQEKPQDKAQEDQPPPVLEVVQVSAPVVQAVDPAPTTELAEVVEEKNGPQAPVSAPDDQRQVLEPQKEATANAATDEEATGKKKASPRGSRLSDDWILPQKWGQWAMSQHPHWTPDDVRKIASKFRNYWVAKTGKDATKLDWYATWQNWCTSDITQREHPAPKGVGDGAVRAAAQMAESKAKSERLLAAMRATGGAVRPATDLVDRVEE